MKLHKEIRKGERVLMELKLLNKHLELTKVIFTRNMKNEWASYYITESTQVANGKRWPWHNITKENSKEAILKRTFQFINNKLI